MTAPLDSVAQSVRATLSILDADDQQLFFQEREQCTEKQLAEGPLLDQLCCLRVVRARLAEGYKRALADFEERLERRSQMSEGWRKSTARKVTGEYESPMPWLHPFRLADEELEPLERELQEAVAAGETAPRDPERLLQVLESHELELPLPTPLLEPRFRPGARAGD
jgi:hypothetical protein